MSTHEIMQQRGSLILKVGRAARRYRIARHALDRAYAAEAKRLGLPEDDDALDCPEEVEELSAASDALVEADEELERHELGVRPS